MSFAWPLVLLLLVLPVFMVLRELGRKRGASPEFAHERILRADAGISSVEIKNSSTRKPNLRRRRLLLPLSLMACIVALARPQWGIIEDPVFEQSREILIGLDLSRSMLSEDIKPRRLDRAKLLVQSLVDHLNGERIGLVVFSGTAFLQSPLSTDYEILRELLPDLGPDFLPEGGTDYDKLLKASLESFSKDSAADRFLIILSDGEALDDTWKDHLKDLQERKIHVIGLGIGTTGGAMVPDGSGGFVKNEQGAAVLSRLEPATLEELARETGGAYREASNWVDLPSLLAATIEAGKQGAFTEKRNARKEDHYQWPLGAGLLLAMLSLALEFPIRVRPRKLSLHAGKVTPGISTVLAVSIILLHATTALALTKDPKTNAEPETKEPELIQNIRSLSTHDSLDAADCSKLAQSTLDWGTGLREAGQPIPPAVVRDGLEAVRLGESLKPKAADWASLKHKLEELLSQKNRQQQQQDQDKKQDKKQEEQKDKNKDKEKASDQKQDKDSSDKSDGEKQPDKQAPEDKKTPPEPPSKDQQKKPEPPPQKPEANGKPDDSKAKEQAFKNMQDPASTPPAQQPPQPRPEEMQKVGGSSDKLLEKDTDPNLVVPLQKLEKLKEDDSPGRLFQLMEGERKPAPKNAKKKNW